MNFNAKHFVIQVLLSGAVVFAFLFFKGNAFLWDYSPPDPLVLHYKWYAIVAGVLLMWWLFWWVTAIIWNLVKR